MQMDYYKLAGMGLLLVAVMTATSVVWMVLEIVKGAMGK